MANVVIYNSDGETLQAQATIVKAEQSTQLLGEDIINVEVGSHEVVDFHVGDYIDWCGHTYTLNQLPKVAKNNSRDFDYTNLVFEGEQYELLDSVWLLPENTYGDSFTGNLKEFLQILISNVSRRGNLWSLGEIPATTEYKTLTFTETNCLNVLQQLCREYKVEFEIQRAGATRVLNIKEQVGALFPVTFQYGRTGGLYKIERTIPTDQNIITRLYVFGSDKNLPSNYRAKKLCLPGADRNDSYITDDDSVEMYGIKENIKVFSDIFPARYGKVTAIDHGDCRIFYDNTMDFDLKETKPNGDTKWLIAGTTAKIQFNTGSLAGYSIELTDYDNELKQFKLKYYTDANGLQFPNPSSAAFQIKVGDEYFITDIRLPLSYVEAAETKLKTEAEKYYEENCTTHANYTISIAPLFLQNLYGDSKLTYKIFTAGDSVTVQDFDLGLSKTLRISGFKRNLLKPYEITITIAEDVEVMTTYQRIVRELTQIKTQVNINDISAAERARRNYILTQEVLESVFDPEGNYYSEKIKPLSIETIMLAVGARSQQFILSNVNFEPNSGGNPQHISNTAGTLEHFTINEPDIRVWNINSGFCDLSNAPEDDRYDPSKPFYIYAKCPRTGNTGFILFSQEQHTVEENATYYYFMIGTLSTVITDAMGARPARCIALTYGGTTINGRFIKTGRIQSADGSTFIDLDQNLVGGKLNFKDGIISGDIKIGASSSTAAAGINATGEMRMWVGGAENNPTFALFATGDAKFGNVEIKNNAISGMSSSQLYRWSIGANGNIFVQHRQTTESEWVTIFSQQDGAIDAGSITSRGALTATDYIKGRELRIANPTAMPNYTAFVPGIMWCGRVWFSDNDDTYNATRHKGQMTVTVQRLARGKVQVSFAPAFANVNDYFITAQGDTGSDNVGYVSVVTKEASGIVLKISDDDSTNDFDFYLQIWLIP